MEALLTELVKNGGLFGIIVGVFGLALRATYMGEKASQTDRVKDAQATVDRILDLVQKAEESKRELTRAIDENTEATRQLYERCPGTPVSQLRRG
jgi:hypothetical protein